MARDQGGEPKRRRSGTWQVLLLMIAGFGVVTWSYLNYIPPIGPYARADDRVGAWPVYGGNDSFNKYSGLNQINRENVRALKVAWQYSTGDLARIEATGTQSAYAFQTTPILVDGLLVGCSQRHRVFALDPVTGRERWSFDPALHPTKQGDAMLKCRGVAAWTDADAPADAPCRTRLLLGASTSVFAIDARNGRLCPGFGQGGVARIKAPGLEFPDEMQLRSPPAIIDDVAVFGSTLRDIYRINSPSGKVRAFDLRTGALRWEYDPVPRDPANPARATWGKGSADYVGSANVWSFATADPKNHLVFLPTTSPSADFYGALRPGDNKWANSIVALDSRTGKQVWAFQTTHHDIWDTDLPAGPILTDIIRDGRRIPALVLLTKQSYIFVFNRLTGVPIYPIVEKPVPRHTDIPGEWISPTQPYPTVIPPLSRLGLKPDEAWGFTPWDRAKCRALIASFNSDGQFTPPTRKGTILMPSGAGGMNWGGGALDPTSNLLIVPTYDIPARVRMIPRTATTSNSVQAHGGKGAEEAVWPMKGTPYTADLQFVTSPFGAPCSPPPWAKLSAVDLNTGRIRWQVPMGSIENLAPIPIPWILGAPFAGGPIVTAGGIAFMAGGTDNKIRAYDTRDGQILWTARLPASGMAVPMTYSVGGQQYVVIAAGGNNIFPGKIGDSVVAFTLPH